MAFHEPARDIAESIHQAGALTVYEVRDDPLFSRGLLESTRRNTGAPQWISIGEPLFVPSKNGFPVTNQNHVRQQVDVTPGDSHRLAAVARDPTPPTV
jgi:hypothetical protein